MDAQLLTKILDANSCLYGVGLRYWYSKDDGEQYFQFEGYSADNIDTFTEFNSESFVDDIIEHSKHIMDLVIDKPTLENGRDIAIRLNQATAMIALKTRRAAGNTVWAHPKNDLSEAIPFTRVKHFEYDSSMPEDLIIVSYTTWPDDESAVFRSEIDKALFKHFGKYYNPHLAPRHSWKQYFFAIHVNP